MPPPVVKKPDDFELEIPDADELAKRERLAKEVREAILASFTITGHNISVSLKFAEKELASYMAQGYKRI